MSEKINDVRNQKKDDFFKYKAQTSRYSFPLDYPVDHIAKKWEVDRRTVKEYIVGNPLFSQFYQHMRYDGEYSKQGNEKHKVFDGIPVELEYFFEELFNYVFCNRIKEFKQGNIPATQEENFCLELYKKATNAEKLGTQDNLYLFRRLYDNAAFQEVLLKEYWNEFKKRCKLLENLTQKLDGDAQIEKLRSILGTLDMEIAVQARRVANLQREHKKNTSFLETFPSELLDELRGRKIILSHLRDETAKFEFPNLPVSHPTLDKKTLQAAFDDVVNQKNGASDVVEDARKVYMEYIRGLSAKTSFQSQCEALQMYLSDYRKPLDIEKIKGEIQTISTTFYGSIVRGEPISVGVYYDGLAKNRDYGEKQRFIIDEVNYIYSQFAYDYKDYLAYLGPTDWDKDEKNLRLKQVADWAYMKTSETEMDCFYQNRTDWYLSSVEMLWEPKCFGEFTLFCENFDAESNLLSEKMAMLCKNTYDLFNTEIPYWADSLYIKCGWKRYREIMKDKKKMLDTAGVHYNDINLIRALFTCKLYTDFRKTNSLVLEHIQYLHGQLYEYE